MCFEIKWDLLQQHLIRSHQVVFQFFDCIEVLQARYHGGVSNEEPAMGMTFFVVIIKIKQNIIYLSLQL